MKGILIFGATSAIAVETARLFAKDGAKFCLVARDRAKMEVVRDDLQARGAGKIVTTTADLNELQKHAGLFDEAKKHLDRIDVVLIAHGTLPDQKKCETDVQETINEFSNNAVNTISLLTHAANQLEVQRSGTIATITSVAGDRGRQSNYIYGAAKSAVNTFMAGLRNRMQRTGVQVLTIKPGFVDTPMTAHLQKNALFSAPIDIANGIYDAITRKKDVVYLPGYWRLIMLVIRIIPESLFKRLKL